MQDTAIEALRRPTPTEGVDGSTLNRLTTVPHR